VLEIGCSSVVSQDIEEGLMSVDPFLPDSTFPAAEGECYVVRGRQVGAFVEISLSHDRDEKHRFRSDTQAEIEELAFKRFPHDNTSAYTAYADRLEDAARYAARGELGYTLNSVVEGAGVRISLVGRLLADDGHLETTISHEQYVDDPEQAHDKAEELRATARELNDRWGSQRRADLRQRRADYENADARDEAAEARLDRIVDAERE
jgi:hypothetical protein